VPTQIALNAGDAQTATAGSAVAVAPSVIVKDASNNPVSGVSVTFAVASGGGSVVGGSATTNASGIATVTSWTLGTTAGANSLTATSGSLTGSPVTFTATGAAGAATQIAVNAGNNQNATVGTAVSTLPSVIVKDVNNNPVSGVSVTFAVASGGGSLTGANATTNASGIATVGSWTLGSSVGANTLTATSGSLTGSPVTFTATGDAGAATQIAVNAGNNQSATVATAVSTAPSVIVRDALNNPVSGVSVTFAVASGGGSLTGANATTHASGIATVGSWTLGTTSGANTMTATSGSLSGSPVTITATGTAGAADVIAKTAGDGQTGTAGGQLGSSIEVRVTDSFGNGKPGVTVTFTPAGGSGSVGSTTAVTDASGLASVTWTLGTTAGAQSVTATMPSGSTTSVTFNATATAGAAATITIDVQPAVTGTGDPLDTQPVITVKDQFGNAVGAGVAVTASLNSQSGSGSGTLNGSTTLQTDAAGKITWSLGVASAVSLDAYSITFTIGAVSATTASIVIP
jgi:adhesin/invasin